LKKIIKFWNETIRRRVLAKTLEIEDPDGRYATRMKIALFGIKYADEFSKKTEQEWKMQGFTRNNISQLRKALLKVGMKMKTNE
jgi:hypothetical protein